jgi:hypothetical protein
MLLAVCALALGIGLPVFLVTAETSGPPHDERQTPEPSHEDQQIQQLEDALAQTTNPTERANIEGKLNVLEHDRASELHARSQDQSGPAAAATSSAKIHNLMLTATALAMTPTPSAPAGTPAGAGWIAGPLIREPAAIFISKNQWYENLPDGTIRVVSAGQRGYGTGSIPAGPQGEIEVWDASGGRMTGVAKVDSPGGPHGALTVTGAQGDVVTLSAADGTIFHFDAGTLTFVNP